LRHPDRRRTAYRADKVLIGAIKVLKLKEHLAAIGRIGRHQVERDARGIRPERLRGDPALDASSQRVMMKVKHPDQLHTSGA